VQRTSFFLAGAAAILMLPSLVMGTLPSHSSMHNLTWAAQFSDQVRLGIPYPRWMAQSFDGLGAPSFYFYPPLAFWLDALLNVVTFDSVPTPYRLSLTSSALILLSGVGFHAWLRLEQASPRVALIGAIAYMAAPYHLIDHYIRGAFAEFAAYTTLPFVFCALALLARQHRFGGPALALAYAALVTSHLPTALLISLTAVPAYVLFSAWRLRVKDRWFVLRSAAGFALGLALAALYLLPALGLQGATMIEWLWTWGFKVEESYLLMPWRWVQGADILVIVCSVAGGALLAVAALVASRRVREAQAMPLLWAAVAFAGILLMSGIVPLQNLPLVSQVGFAWRLLIVVEFAVITALCLAPWVFSEWAGARLLLLAAVAISPAVGILGKGIADRIALLQGGAIMRWQDAREYLPAGYPQKAGAEYQDIGLELIRNVPLIACQPAARRCEAAPSRLGEMRIEVEAGRPTQVTVRRFAFPAWQLDPMTPIVASERLRLVSFTAPVGTTSFRLERRILPQEREGGWISLAALIVLAGWAGFSARNKRS
jgi:hypothetical protein